MPGTGKPICTGVVFVAAAALDGAGGGSLPGAVLTGPSGVPAEESRGSGAVERSLGCFIPMFALLGGVLIQRPWWRCPA